MDEQAELERLKTIEAQYYLIIDENHRLRTDLNNERFKNADLQDAQADLVQDMSLMEARIAELMGVYE